MNILILTTHANTGGITSYLLTLAGGLVQQGHHVVVVSSGGNCVAEFEALGVRHIRMNVRTKFECHPKLLLAWPKLRRLIREHHINIIHAQTRVTQVLGFCLSRREHLPLITTCHGFFKPRWFRRILPCWGNGVIAISRPVAEHLRRDFHLKEENIHQITNGIDLNRFVVDSVDQRQALRRQWGVDLLPVIGIIARLSVVKGIDVLINAMPDVIAKIPDAVLMIVGQGPHEQYLRDLVAAKGLGAHVRFEPTVNHTARVLPLFDVFVMPSRMEGLGLSVMEAQAKGIVVIASNVGGLPDLIEDGVSGYLTPVGDAHDLAVKITAVLTNPLGAKAMAQRARERIEQQFTSARMINKTIEAYEQHLRR